MTTLLALVIEDNQALSRAFERVLQKLGYRVELSHSIADARQKIRNLAPTLLLVDIDLPDGNGLDLMDELRNSTRERFIVISGNSSQRAAIKSIRHRAVEFVSKPVSLSDLKRLIGNAVTQHADRIGVSANPESQTPQKTYHESDDCWINHGTCTALVELRTAISFSAELRRGHAIIVGDSGLEKQSIAMELHKRSRRSGKIVFLDCAAKPDASTTLHENLFGYGDTPDVSDLATGCIGKAVGGTLVLNNVDHLPDELQSALSLFLDTGIFKRSKTEQRYKATLAVVGIMSSQANSNSLGADIMTRLSQVTLNVPGLQECLGDLIPISRWLLTQICKNSPNEITDYIMSESMEAQISEATWPDNIRELRETIQAAVNQSMRSNSSTRELHLPHTLQQNSEEPLKKLIGLSLRDFGNQLVIGTLAYHHGDKAKTAQTLGISLKTLYNRLNSY